MTKPLTDEELRILRAAAERRLHYSSAGRWEIDGEDRPDRRSRERLRSRGLTDYGRTPAGRPDWGLLIPTTKGHRVLERAAEVGNA